MIEPVSEDFTMLTRPACKAKPEMMISGALPSEALSRPPMVGPRNLARASVASPINPARGTIASAEVRNTRIGLAPNPVQADSDRQEYQQPVQGHCVAPSAAVPVMGQAATLHESDAIASARLPRKLSKWIDDLGAVVRRGLQCAAGASSERPRIASARWLPPVLPRSDHELPRYPEESPAPRKPPETPRRTRPRTWFGKRFPRRNRPVFDRALVAATRASAAPFLAALRPGPACPKPS